MFWIHPMWKKMPHICACILSPSFMVCPSYTPDVWCWVNCWINAQQQQLLCLSAYSVACKSHQSFPATICLNIALICQSKNAAVVLNTMVVSYHKPRALNLSSEWDCITDTVTETAHDVKVLCFASQANSLFCTQTVVWGLGSHWFFFIPGPVLQDQANPTSFMHSAANEVVQFTETTQFTGKSFVLHQFTGNSCVFNRSICSRDQADSFP